MAAVCEKDIIEEIKKKKGMSNRKQPDKKVFLTEPGDNRKLIQHSMDVFQLPDFDNFDAEKVYQRSLEYLEICTKNDMKPSIAGYALALKMSRMELNNLIAGRLRNNERGQKSVAVMRQFHSMITSQMEDLMQNGKINPVSGIFLMKNNMGYQDKTEISFEANKQSDQLEDSELINQAKMLPDNDEQ